MLTLDNGKEFAVFKQVEQATGLRVFFADPYCTWRAASMRTPTDCYDTTSPRALT